MKKLSAAFIAMVLACAALLFSCGKDEGGNVISLGFGNCYEIALEEGESHRHYVDVEVKDYDKFFPDEILIFSEDENIASAVFTYPKNDTHLFFEIDAVSVGETYIYAQTADGSVTSEKLLIVVKESK